MSQPRVQILHESLINKIAAGEVVERPASVVKELVENSIDAGADQIFVTIKNGGKDSISVLDNGRGMPSEDAALAVERHATSKIHTEEDLENIHTMGFRGEALAAISAVSRFELTTCNQEQEGGFQVRIDGGKLKHSAKVGFPLGTRINVENLFFNTPARLKFMKSPNTEYGHIYDLMVRFALGYPAIQFRLTHNRAIVFNTNKGQDLKERIRHCFGSEIADDLIECEHEESYLSFSGLVSLPEKGRSSKRWQHTFVNQRYVKCQTVNHGIYEAYKTLLMKNMHPMFFMRVTLPTTELDVNVHPAKTEIRLRNPTLIHTIFADHLSRILRQGSRNQFFAPLKGASIEDSAPLFEGLPSQDQTEIPSPSKAEVASPTSQGVYRNVPDTAQGPSKDPVRTKERSSLPDLQTLADSNRRTAFNNQTALPQNPSSKPQSSLSKEPPKAISVSVEPNEQIRFVPDATPKPTLKQAPTGKSAVNTAQTPITEDPFSFAKQSETATSTKKSFAATESPSRYKVLGQLHNKYILAQGENSLVLVDQHAAHERIRFEEIKNQFYKKSSNPIQLLIPVMVELSPQDGLLLEQHQEAWRNLGFVIDHFGGNDYSVKEVPALIKDADIPLILHEVLDEMAEFGKSGKLETFYNEVFERMACHSAIRAAQSLTQKEMESLLAQMEQLDLNLHCPHGRPVVIEIEMTELDKRFRRIV